MNESIFQLRMLHTQLMMDVHERRDYWLGYRRGLRRAFYGEAFGTEEDHQLWLSLADRDHKEIAERGLGYLDALRAETTG